MLSVLSLEKRKMVTYNRTWQVFALTTFTLIGQVVTVIAINSSRGYTYSYFTSRASHVVAKRDQSVSLVCSVAVEKEGVRLDWWLLNYEAQLTSGSRQLLLSKKHSISYVEGSDGNCTAILTIDGVRPIDSGYYACRFENGSGRQEQITGLFVEGTLQIEDEFYDYEDMTECCRSFGVHGMCLDLCSPFELFSPDVRSTNSVRQEFKDCGGEVMLALMECGAGRNNIPCCLERNVSSQCSKLCGGILDDKQFDLDKCSVELPDMALCFSRGLANIPPPLTDIRATIIHHLSIIVEWSMSPWSHGNDEDLKPWFLVFRSNDLIADEQLFHMEVVQVKDLNSSMRLDLSIGKIVVVPANQYGASSRGAGLELGLFGARPSLPDSIFSLSECCTKQGVPVACHSFLCGTFISNNSTESRNKCSCYQHVGKVSKCIAASKADVRECCSRRKVSRGCLPLCSGNAKEPNLGMLHCFHEMPYIKTCLEGIQADLEFIPLEFLVSNITCCSATFSWKNPLDQTTLFRYILRYREINKEQFVEVITPNLFATIRGMKPNADYEAVVIAILLESNISDLSNSVKFRTKLSPDLWKPKFAESLPVFSLSQDSVVIVADPSSKLVAIGQRVRIACFSQQPRDSVACHWMVKSLTFKEAVLEIASVNETSSGVYTCVCGRNHKSYTLNVQSAPVFITKGDRYKGISPQRVVHHPISSHLAELTCYFEGFPDIVTWYKDGREIGVSSSFTSSPASSLTSSRRDMQPPQTSYWLDSRSSSTDIKYTSTKYSHEDQGILYYKLSIEPFQPSDVGVYTCYGSNRYASDAGTIHLITGDTIVEAIHPHGHPALVSDCCKKSNVSERCLVVCTFEVDPDRLMEISWECHKEFHLIMQCSSRGWNYSSCCASVDIPDHCLSLCQGGGVTSDPHLACDCINFANEILSCHSKGHSFTPPPPSSVHHKTLENGLLVLRIVEPVERLELVTGYLVNWTSIDGNLLPPVNGHQILKPNEELNYYGYQLEPFRSYIFTIQSYNRHSLSTPYTLAEIKVTEPPILEKLDISLAVYGIRQVKTMWKEPPYKLMEKIDIQFYIGRKTNFSSKDTHGMTWKEFSKMEGEPESRALLSGPLETGKWYGVVARIRSTNYRGSWSDIQPIFIPDKAQVAGLIVTVAVCISLGAMIIIISWIVGVRCKRKKTLSQESVSFENSTPFEVAPEQQIPDVHLPGQFTYLEFQNEIDDHHSDNRTGLCR